MSTVFDMIQNHICIRGGPVVRWCWVSFQYRSFLLICIITGQGPAALAVGVCVGCLVVLSLVYHFSLLSPSPSRRRPDID